MNLFASTLNARLPCVRLHRRPVIRCPVLKLNAFIRQRFVFLGRLDYMRAILNGVENVHCTKQTVAVKHILLYARTKHIHILTFIN